MVDRRNGTESERFHEEFTRFTLNPDIPTSVFLWTPPEDPAPTASTSPSGAAKHPAAKKRKPVKTRRLHSGRLNRSARLADDLAAEEKRGLPRRPPAGQDGVKRLLRPGGARVVAVPGGVVRAGRRRPSRARPQ